ncbi:MAG: hypothetical protein Mars2KO_44270 [Maribacter sp.]
MNSANFVESHLYNLKSIVLLSPRVKRGKSSYSFRHSFQDRLTAFDVKDRIQCQLMGHKFNRPVYGNGTNLEYLERIISRVNYYWSDSIK